VGFAAFADPGVEEALTDLTRKYTQWIVNLKIWVALSVTALALFCQDIILNQANLALNLRGASARIVFAATLAIYNLDGALDCIGQAAALRRRRGAHILLTFIAGTWFHVELLMLGNWRALPIGVGFALCTLYGLKLGFGHRKLTIKSIPVVKAPFIGIAVATAAVLVPKLCAPAAGVNVISTSKVIVLLASLSCFCTANAQLFDIVDLSHDRSAGIRTTPFLIGVRGTQVVGIVLIAIGLVFAQIGPETAQVPLWGLGLALFASSGLLQPSTSKPVAAFWVDGALGIPLILRTILH
jgi:hypothetical protein